MARAFTSLSQTLLKNVRKDLVHLSLGILRKFEPFMKKRRVIPVMIGERRREICKHKNYFPIPHRFCLSISFETGPHLWVQDFMARGDQN